MHRCAEGDVADRLLFGMMGLPHGAFRLKVQCTLHPRSLAPMGHFNVPPIAAAARGAVEGIKT